MKQQRLKTKCKLQRNKTLQLQPIVANSSMKNKVVSNGHCCRLWCRTEVSVSSSSESLCKVNVLWPHFTFPGLLSHLCQRGKTGVFWCSHTRHRQGQRLMQNRNDQVHLTSQRVRQLVNFHSYRNLTFPLALAIK